MVLFDELRERFPDLVSPSPAAVQVAHNQVSIALRGPDVREIAEHLISDRNGSLGRVTRKISGLSKSVARRGSGGPQPGLDRSPGPRRPGDRRAPDFGLRVPPGGGVRRRSGGGRERLL